MPKLIIGTQEYTFSHYASIGRASKCTISFADDIKLSRVHCEIIQDDEDFILIDLHSQNGTQLNGKAITERILKSGDIITLGKASLTFQKS